ncbi:hypothetical protein SapgrDRAFT_2858 [Saprospira grandis DSM 2844]|uniref:Uncharacterized protein n=1 Tax=Saprospira grandis DSM 2844 TaxID=694433 RepID=J0PA81_9BACT|nr:hypothetical protein SapgrDRAFT_2858 [Saprospira grandis DSM 2844]
MAEGWKAGPPKAADQRLLKRSEKACRAEQTCELRQSPTQGRRPQGQPQKNKKLFNRQLDRKNAALGLVLSDLDLAMMGGHHFLENIEA